MAKISAVFRGDTVTVDMDRWMFGDQRRLSRLLGMTRPEWGDAFGRQEPAAVAFLIYLGLCRAGKAPDIDGPDEFRAWWDSDDFDFDLASIDVDDGTGDESEPEDESHLPTISAGQP